MMDKLWGIFGKRLVDLNLDEQVILALVVLISVCLVVIAFSLVLQVARGLDSRAESVGTNRLLRPGLGRVSQIDYYQDQPRPSHTD